MLILEYGEHSSCPLGSALRVPDPKDVLSCMYEKKVRWSAIARDRVAVARSAG